MNLFDLAKQPLNIAVIGDSGVHEDIFEEALRKSSLRVNKTYKFFWGTERKLGDDFSKRRIAVERGGPEGYPTADGLKEVMPELDMIITHYCPVTRAAIEKAPRLKAILVCRGGVDNVDIKAASEHGIPVMHVIRNTQAVVEFTLGMIINVTRNISLSSYYLKNHVWTNSFYNDGSVRNLNSQLVGILGIGNIGAVLAEKLHALGVSVIGWDPFITQEQLDAKGMNWLEMVPTKEEIFSRADIVTLHIRYDQATQGIVDKSCFDKMKPTAYFINIARGGLIVQDDLIAALREKKLAGAALDVFDREPVDLNCPLLEMENVVATPHLAGMTLDSIELSPFQLMKEAEAWLRTGDTRNIVNIAALNGEKV